MHSAHPLPELHPDQQIRVKLDRVKGWKTPATIISKSKEPGLLPLMTWCQNCGHQRRWQQRFSCFHVPSQLVQVNSLLYSMERDVELIYSSCVFPVTTKAILHPKLDIKVAMEKFEGWQYHRGKQQEQTDLGPHHDRNIGQREKYRYCQHLVNYWACL